VAKIAPADPQDQYDPLCQVGGPLLDGRHAGQSHHQRRQAEQANDDVSAVDHQAATPLPQVVPLRFEDEMFVPEKGEGNTDQGSERTGEQVGMGEIVCQGSLEKREAAVAKEGIDASNREILQPVTR